ncbi:ribosomal protein S18 acetylase RimI-like enzyme [Actinoallomurus bryophytorum]|uniref:Ribosomal protein S18 acetylase RimI-like enzyme n=1 Tax=Actinoallomurus bryophytorum TaxID=1490222 RepID=A0A543CDQ7_9ACTN|nr:ribosomal protein S18 acetylase RimI-like enzyme [Actinoallomurus bryophytorum]
MTVRDAGPEDAEALARVRSLSWRSAYDGLLSPALIEIATGPDWVERQRAFLTETPGRRALLAEDGDAAVGMAVYGPDRDPGGHAELYAIYVLPGYWSKNVGAPLMDGVLDGVRTGGYSRIALWVLAANLRARRFYERYGFAATEQKIIERFGHMTYDVRYEREVR